MPVPPEETTQRNESAEDSCKSGLSRLVPFLASLFIRFVGKTVRLKVVGEDKLKQARENRRNVIYAFWHNRMLLLIYTHRNHGIHVMISRSRDGATLSRTARRFGFKPVRGSSSRGGSSALLALSKKLQDGVDVAVTPDGPRGPRYRVQMGIIHLAMKTGYPIVPGTCRASKNWVLKSWDRLLVPCPFTKAVLIYGNPIEVSENSNLEDKRMELEQELMAITREADTYFV